MKDHKHGKEDICKLFEKLPPNYPVSSIYLNGLLVTVMTFVSVHSGLAYFFDEEGQVITVDCSRLDGIIFGETGKKEEEC